MVGNDSITDMGLVPLLEALPRLHSLERLVLFWSLSHPDETLNKIGECVGRSTLKQLELLSFSPPLQSEEAVKEWVQSVVVGGNSLIHSLEHSQVTNLKIRIGFRKISCRINVDDVRTQLDSSLQKTMDSINLRRVKKSLHSIALRCYCMSNPAMLFYLFLPFSVQRKFENNILAVNVVDFQHTRAFYNNIMIITTYKHSDLHHTWRAWGRG